MCHHLEEYSEPYDSPIGRVRHSWCARSFRFSVAFRSFEVVLMAFRASIDARRFLQLFGTSRHSALPALRERASDTLRERVSGAPKMVGNRAAALAAGSIMIGAAVALLVKADLGLPPYDVLSSGIQANLGVSLGQAGWIVAGALMAVSSMLGRRPSMWGVAYILANGLAVDAMADLLNSPDGWIGRIGFVVAGIVLMAGGVNVVLFSGTTGGPFELLMAAGEDRGVSRLHTRYALDVGVLLAGLVLGGTFGIATVVYAATMGLTLQVISQVFEDHALGRAVRATTCEVDVEPRTPVSA